MSKSIKRIIVAVCSFMFLVLGAGYATLTDSLQISGTADATPPQQVFITYAQDKGVGDGSATVNNYYLTTLSSKVTLKDKNSSTATIQVTVFNNANQVYAFNAVKYLNEAYSNENIVFVLSGIERRQEIAVGEYLTFDVVFSFKDGKAVSNTVLDSAISFEFLPPSEIPEDEGQVAVNGALEQFKNIINNIVADNSFQTLIDQMNDYRNNDRDNESYIGNVDGASNGDIALIEELFQGNLKLNINGVDTEVTILIKKENVDGNTATGDADGNEMSIYMTTDNLQKQSIFQSRNAVVYASVFTSYDDGETWAQLGDIYEGTAPVIGYNGSRWGDGSFNTDDWKSTDNKTIDAIIKSLK